MLFICLIIIIIIIILPPIYFREVDGALYVIRFAGLEVHRE